MTGKIPKVVTVGGTYIDMAFKCRHNPFPGQNVIGSALSYSVAGPGPNQSIETALCGCDAYLISKVGGDPFAKMAIESLREMKVNTNYVFSADAKNTGVIVTLVNATGENACCIYPGANTALKPQDIDDAEQIISMADACLIHGRLPNRAVAKAIRFAKLHKTKAILNPAWPIEQTRRTKDTLPFEYFSVDVIIPNLCEAADITYKTDASIRTAKLIGSDLVARGVACAVITMGRRGCMVVDRKSADHIPAFEVELVDQAGRGDAFAGALAAYCAVDDDVRGAVKFASAAGALACTKFGTIEALPTKAEIIELLQKEDSGL